MSLHIFSDIVDPWESTGRLQEDKEGRVWKSSSHLTRRRLEVELSALRSVSTPPPQPRPLQVQFSISFIVIIASLASWLGNTDEDRGCSYCGHPPAWRKLVRLSRVARSRRWPPLPRVWRGTRWTRWSPSWRHAPTLSACSSRKLHQQSVRRKPRVQSLADCSSS